MQDTKLEQLLKTQMQWSVARGKVLADNVSHANMPGRRRMDLKDLTFQKMMGSKLKLDGVVKTSPNHLTSKNESSKKFETIVEKIDLLDKGDTAVNLEDEMMHVSTNNNRINLLLNLYRKNIGFYKTVLGKDSNG